MRNYSLYTSILARRDCHAILLMSIKITHYKSIMKKIVLHTTFLLTCAAPLLSAAKKTFLLTIAVTEQAKALITSKTPKPLQELVLTCKPADTIEDLKKLIHSATGMPIAQQQLHFMVAPCYLNYKELLDNNVKCIDYTKPPTARIELTCNENTKQ